MRLFSQIFSRSPKSPLIFFCKRTDVEKLPKGHHFTFSGTMRLTRDQKNFKQNFEKKLGFCFEFFLMRVLWKRILDTLKFFCYFPFPAFHIEYLKCIFICMKGSVKHDMKIRHGKSFYWNKD